MIDEAENKFVLPDFLKSQIIYQDDSIIVINKPAGMPVHSGRGGGDNLQQHLGELQLDYPEIPILAHRLDRDTSGCLILGRNKAALARIGKMFMTGRISKTYWAVVEGKKFEQVEGRIDIPLRKQSQQTHKWWRKPTQMGSHPLLIIKCLVNQEILRFWNYIPALAAPTRYVCIAKPLAPLLLVIKFMAKERQTNLCTCTRALFPFRSMINCQLR